MNNLPPLPLVDGCMFVDHSHGIEPIMTCNRMHEYEFLWRRVSSETGSALNFGTAQHMAREYRYKAYGNDLLDPAYFQNVAMLVSDFFKDIVVPEGDFRTLNWAIEVSKQYDTKYAIESHTLLRYDSPVKCNYCNGQGEVAIENGTTACIWCKGTGKCENMVELSFALPLFTWRGWLPDFSGIKLSHNGEAEVPVFYTGKVDLPFMSEGKIWIRDTKTTSQLGDQFWSKAKMMSQARGYAWAFQQLTGKEVTGYMIDAIRTKEPPIYVTKGEASRTGKKMSPETWWNESLQRERFYLKPGELSQWKANTIELIHEFFWHYQRGVMPMKTEHCARFGKCQYYDVCSMSPEDRGLMLASGQYKDNVWSPLKQVKQETK